MKPFTLTILGWLTLFICHAQPREFEGIVRYSFRAIPKAEGLRVEDLRNMLLQDDSVMKCLHCPICRRYRCVRQRCIDDRFTASVIMIG